MGDDLPVALTASTLEPLIYLAERGQGLACVPIFTVREQLASGALAATLTSFTKSTGKFRVVWPSSRHPMPKVGGRADGLQPEGGEQ